MYRFYLLLFVFLVSPCVAQQVSIGIKAGARLSDDIDSYYAQSESKRYILGPAVEMALPLRFSVEVDALYRRTGFRTANGGFWGSNQSGYRANTWEFPMLLKYHLPFPGVKPYVEVGYAPRHMAGSYKSTGYAIYPPTGAVTPYSSQGKWNPDLSHGLVTGGGVEFGSRHLRIAPEVRYTHWNNDPINFYGNQGYVVHAAVDQVDLLVGIWWRR